MKAWFEFLLGLTLIGIFCLICAHIGFIPSIVFGMLVGSFLSAAHER